VDLLERNAKKTRKTRERGKEGEEIGGQRFGCGGLDPGSGRVGRRREGQHPQPDACVETAQEVEGKGFWSFVQATGRRCRSVDPPNVIKGRGAAASLESSPSKLSLSLPAFSTGGVREQKKSEETKLLGRFASSLERGFRSGASTTQKHKNTPARKSTTPAIKPPIPETKTGVRRIASRTQKHKKGKPNSQRIRMAGLRRENQRTPQRSLKKKAVECGGGGGEAREGLLLRKIPTGARRVFWEDSNVGAGPT